MENKIPIIPLKAPFSTRSN